MKLDFAVSPIGAICTSSSKTQISWPDLLVRCRSINGPLSCCLPINAVYTLAFSEEGAPSPCAIAESPNILKKCSSRSGLDIIPPPPKMFSCACQQSLHSLFSFPCEIRHLTYAAPVPIAPKQRQTIRLRQTGKRLLNSLLLQCFV